MTYTCSLCKDTFSIAEFEELCMKGKDCPCGGTIEDLDEDGEVEE